MACRYNDRLVNQISWTLNFNWNTPYVCHWSMPFIMHTQSGVSLRDQCKKYQTQGPSCQRDANLNLILTSNDKSVISFITQYKVILSLASAIHVLDFLTLIWRKYINPNLRLQLFLAPNVTYSMITSSKLHQYPLNSVEKDNHISTITPTDP